MAILLAGGNAPPVAEIAGDLVIDGQTTPHQFGFVVENLQGLSQLATAEVRVRQNIAPAQWSTWRRLYRVQPSVIEQAPPWAGGVEDVFAWTFFGLEPGTEYAVQLRKTLGADVDFDDYTFTTRALPPAAPAVTRTIPAGSSTVAMQTVVDAMLPGEHLQFLDGTHDIGSVVWPTSMSGSSAGAPTFVSGQSRAGTILRNTAQLPVINLTNNLSNVVFEEFTGDGSGIEEITGFDSSTALYGATTATTQNITIRRTTWSGVNRGVYARSANNAENQHIGWLVYNNTIVGNNEWSDSPLDFFNTNRAWDDYCVLLSGHSHACFGNTLDSFGDFFSCTSGSSGSRSERDRNQYYYWNDCRRVLDDFFETDDGYRNLACYQNIVHNTVNCGSCDVTYGGPIISWGNLFVNVLEPRMFKNNSVNSGWFRYNETMVMTAKNYRQNAVDDNIAISYQPNNGQQDYFGFANIVMVMINGTPDDVLRWEHGGINNADLNHCAFFPDTGFQVRGQVEPNLAALQAAIGSHTPLFDDGVALFQGCVIPASAQQFGTVITLPASANTEVTQRYTMANFSAAGSIANAGRVIPNITDNLTESFDGIAPDMGCNVSGLTLPMIGDTTAVNMPAYADGMADYDVRQLTGQYAPAGAETLQVVTPTVWVNEAANGPGRTFFGIISAYSGGAGVVVVDTEDGRLALTGGGHNDSGNNCMAIFDPREVGLVAAGWENPVDISDNAIVAPGTSAAHSDGRWRSVHSYSGLCYAPHRNLYYRVGGSSFSGPGTFLNDLWQYDPTLAQGSRHTQLADIPGNSDDGIGLVCDVSADKLIAVDPQNGSYIFDIAAGTWSAEAGLTAFDNFDTNIGYDPSRNVVLATMANGTTRVIEYNLTTDTIVSQAAITWTGDTAIVNTASARMYDPDLDRWWFFGGQTAGNYNRIAYASGADVAAGGNVAVTEVTLSANKAATGFNEAIIGTFDRFLFVRSTGLLYETHRVDEGVWITKLPRA